MLTVRVVPCLDVRDGRVCAVETPDGAIACEAVVLCAGLWSRQLGRMAGASVPLYACEHFYLLTKPIAGIEGHLPTLGDHDGYLYMRDDVGGRVHAATGMALRTLRPISL